MEATKPTFDCQKCGACCRCLLVDIEEDEVQRLNKTLVSTRGFNFGGRLKRKRYDFGWGCIALKEKNGKFACSIYKKRPFVCEAFSKGSDFCIECRNNMGII